MAAPALGRFGRQVAQVAGGTAAGQALLVLASPVLARVFGPAEFGALAVHVALVSVAVTAASLRLELALPLPRREGQAAALLALCLLLVLATTLVASLALAAGRHRILAWMGQPGLAHWLWLAPLSLLGAGLNQVFSCWAIRKRRFDRIGRTRVTQAFTQVAVQLGLGAAGGGAAALLAGDALGRANGTRTLATLDLRRDRRRLAAVGWPAMAAALRRYRAFPLWSGATALLNACNLRLPALAMAACYGPAAAGFLDLAQRILAVPGAVIGEAVAQVFLGESAALAAQGRSLRPLFLATVRRMALLGLLVTTLAATAGWFLLPVVFGPAWTPAARFLLAAAPMAFAQFAGACVGHALVTLERQDLALVREAVRGLLQAGGFAAALGLRWSAQGAVWALAGTGTLAYGFYAWITWYAIRQAEARP